MHAAATDETWRDVAAAARVAAAAAAAAPSPRPRVVQLALLPVVGRDFHCTGADGSAPGKCQVRCGKDANPNPDPNPNPNANPNPNPNTLTLTLTPTLTLTLTLTRCASATWRGFAACSRSC